MEASAAPSAAARAAAAATCTDDTSVAAVDTRTDDTAQTATTQEIADDTAADAPLLFREDQLRPLPHDVKSKLSRDDRLRVLSRDEVNALAGLKKTHKSNRLWQYAWIHKVDQKGKTSAVKAKLNEIFDRRRQQGTHPAISDSEKESSEEEEEAPSYYETEVPADTSHMATMVYSNMEKKDKNRCSRADIQDMLKVRLQEDGGSATDICNAVLHYIVTPARMTEADCVRTLMRNMHFLVSTRILISNFKFLTRIPIDTNANEEKAFL